MSNPTPEDLISYEAAAELAKCSLSTIYARIKSGELTPHEAGEGFQRRKMLSKAEVQELKPAPRGRPKKAAQAEPAG